MKDIITLLAVSSVLILTVVSYIIILVKQSCKFHAKDIAKINNMLSTTQDSIFKIMSNLGEGEKFHPTLSSQHNEQSSGGSEIRNSGHETTSK